MPTPKVKTIQTPIQPENAPSPDGSPAARLASALEAMGANLLAGRVRSVREVAVVGDVLRLGCKGLPAATVKSLREGGEQLAAAARKAGLPATVEVHDNGPAEEPAKGGLRAKVEADEAVQRVLEVFGGRIERVEEKP